jgi:hypothetical protein
MSGRAYGCVGAAIETSNPLLVPLHLSPKNFLEELALVVTNHRKAVEAVEDGRVKLRDPVGSGGVIKRVLCHITVLFSKLGEATIARFTFQFLKFDFVALSLCLVDVMENLFGS